MMSDSAFYQLKKAPTGIQGLDEITYGGFPQGRPTLITGYAGSGKTVLAMQFILNGIKEYGDPGVYISLEESDDDLRDNMASFGYDLQGMENDNMLCLENIKLNHAALFQSGRFDLTPVFIRIEEAVKKVNARRIAIDTFELIFTDIQNINIFRQELMRLVRWLKEKGLTAIFTSESPESKRKISGIEEFITDCVINLKHQVSENIYTRRLHILKYRGSRHGTNEYPFLIGIKGIIILPITSVEVHKISSEVISTGILGLDEKIERNGLYVGSSTLISGTSGSGKTSLAVSVCVQAMKQKKRCLYFTFEESIPQLERNMRSLGFDLEHFASEGLLKICSTRTTLYGIETHLVTIYSNIEEFDPEVVVFDPVTDLIQIGSRMEVRSMLLRIIDYLKSRLVTIIFSALISSSSSYDLVLGISSLVDGWIRLGFSEKNEEREQLISIVKVRGMNHSRKRYFLDFGKDGLKIREINGSGS